MLSNDKWGGKKMSQSKKRYKAVIGDKNYTIIGNESKAHMDAVVSLANHQLEMIGKKSPDINLEQKSVLLAINALSDQLTLQHTINELKDQMAILQAELTECEALKKEVAKVKELEKRLHRYESIEAEAKRAIINSTKSRQELSPAEVQKIMNKQSLAKIEQDKKRKG